MSKGLRFITDIRHERVPDVWDEIERRAEEPLATDRTRARRAPVAAAATLVIALTLIGSSLYAFRELSGRATHPGDEGSGITRYALDGAPQPLAVGLGAAWTSVSPMTDRGTGTPSLWRIDEATGEVREVEGTSGVEWVAVGDDSVWATCGSAACGGDGVLRISPDGKVVATIALDASAYQIVAGPGVVWVTDGDGIVAIDPASNRVAVTFPGSFDLVGIGGGLAWTTTENQGGSPQAAVGLDPATGRVVAEAALPDPCHMEVTPRLVFLASCDGGMHAGSDTDELVALDADNGRVLYRVPVRQGQMRLVGETLWVAGRSDDGGSIVLTPYEANTGAPSGQPFVIASGASRFDHMSMFPPHVFFAADGASLWVTDFIAGEVIRVPVAAAQSPSPTVPVAVTKSPAATPTATVTVVPSVIGLSAETARQVLSDAGFEVRTEIVPGTYKDAAIIEQTPSAGSRVDPRSRVMIVIGPAAHVAETASDVLHVTCQPDGTATVESAAVQAQADGLHVVVDDQAGAEAVVFTQASRPGIAWSSGSNGLDGEFVSLVAPGETIARCQQAGTTYDTSKVDPAATTFVVLDPNAYWTSADLACGPLDDSWAMKAVQPVDPLVKTIDDAARMAAPGIRDNDLVESAGYTASRIDAGLVRVVRDGQVIAWLRDGFGEGWSFGGYACPGSGIGGQ